MKIPVLCLPIALCFSLINAVGLDGDITITTASSRLQPIRDLKVGDEVVCYSTDLQQKTSTIKGICEINVDSTIALTTTDGITMHVSPTERFYLPKEGAWVFAKSLKEGDCLLNEDMDTIAITKLEQQDGSQKLFVITVDGYHNFLATAGKYLVHNGPLLGGIFYCATKAVAYGVMLAGAGAAIGTTGGSAILLAGAGEALGLAGAATTGTGVVATLVSSSATATAVASSATGAVAATGAMGCVIGAIEGWALYFMALGTAVPCF